MKSLRIIWAVLAVLFTYSPSAFAADGWGAPQHVPIPGLGDVSSGSVLGPRGTALVGGCFDALSLGIECYGSFGPRRGPFRKWNRGLDTWYSYEYDDEMFGASGFDGEDRLSTLGLRSPRPSRPVVRNYSASGRRLSTQRIARTTRANKGRLAVNSRGAAVAIWQRGRWQTQATFRRSRSHRFGSVQTFSGGSGWGGCPPVVVIWRNGAAMIAWQRQDDERGSEIRMSYKRAGSTRFTHSRPMSSTIAEPECPVLATGRRGHAAIGWLDVTRHELVVRVARSLGRFSRRVHLKTMQEPSQSFSRTDDLALGIDHGQTFVAWGGTKGEAQVRFARVSRRGHASVPQMLSAGTVQASRPKLTVDSRGSALIAWSQGQRGTFATSLNGTAWKTSQLDPGANALGVSAASDGSGNSYVAYATFLGPVSVARFADGRLSGSPAQIYPSSFMARSPLLAARGHAALVTWYTRGGTLAARRL